MRKAKAKTNEELARERELEDLAFIKDPMMWPNLVLPLKTKGGGRLRCGFICDPKNPTVVIGNVWALPMSKEQFNAAEKITYSSLEELVKVWAVD